jgi:hypothetical protein
MPAAEKPVLPENAVEVKVLKFWDTGFDPRFDVGGNCLLVPEGLPKRTMRQVIVEIVAYYLFVFKAYCSPWSEERHLRKTILSGASLEKVWSSYYVRALVEGGESIEAPPCVHWIPLAEHGFLEKTGDIFRKLTPSSLPPRPFPREVILPIHAMNKPQKADWGIEKIKPGPEKLENMDFVRMGHSFLRLSKVDFTSPDNEKPSFDLFEYDYVPHYLFIHAIQESAQRLKLACRELRLQIAQAPTDFKCAFSFVSCQEKLRPVFIAFNQAWQEYVQSHELLTEKQEIWSQVDYHAQEYAALMAETKLSSKKAEKNKVNGGRLSKTTYRTCQDAVKMAYIEEYPLSKTGRLLKVLNET